MHPQRTLLRPMMMGTPAALAWLMASCVCGRTPSSAATTMTATSVTFVPRARIALKACTTSAAACGSEFRHQHSFTRPLANMVGKQGPLHGEG